VRLSTKGSYLRTRIVLATLVVSVGGGYAQAPPSNRAKSTLASKTLIPESGSVSNGVYRNPFFGISYKVPYGWVERTKQMHEEEENDPVKGLVLLAAFARPPEATGDTVNAAVVIAAESASSYPGLKTAANYFVPLTEVTMAKGFKLVNEPYEFPIGAKQLVRADFSKELGKLTMHQTSLVMLKKGYVVSFTFIGGSDDEVQELVEGLSFTSSPRAVNRRSAPPKH
jgi:hypothetical protein